ncbi:hypothetical protein F9U39_15830 [Pectobacterium versatile]|uniref:Uncharacterized protein n=2 Tax=Pectobacterium TaxID=122277 RepID=A0AAW3SW11_9GAMM|nr:MULTISPECIES: hypothetical protein [Pectobacterium]MBA5204741.1 hypothetical protein [Pectobacterium aroidearum]MBN3170962.1 hypothetical protein [Pectobacterium brasiliense]MBN3176399.1 hypothetical protein [Pectobacterium parmentieri]MBQ4790899.1 hypothetical protein [Pectobacterium versatile]QHQ23409.1 hypothetical protein GMX10_04450 [Pectobacterium parvum]
MSKLPIECVGDFLKIINEISKKSNDAQLYFRGQSDASWGIDSSLSRLLNDSDIRPYAADGKSPEWQGGIPLCLKRIQFKKFDNTHILITFYQSVIMYLTCIL